VSNSDKRPDTVGAHKKQKPVQAAPGGRTMLKPTTAVKFTTLLLAVFFTVLLFYRGVREVVNKYEYSRTIKSYWDLGVKASTLEKKSEYLDQFVAGLNAANLSGNNAIFLKTPDNSYEQNFAALTSLQTRMHEISEMNPKSFEYQLAIGQITAQEQGEAGKMLSQFEGIWYLNRHPTYWKWYDTIFWVLNLVFAFLAWFFFGGAIALDKQRGQQTRVLMILLSLFVGLAASLLTAGVFLQ
jgi:hypothetical protein